MKLRYAERAKGDETCNVHECRIRGRYRLPDGNRICYGHLSKWAVDRVLEDGTVKDEPQAQYVNTKRERKPRRNAGAKADVQ